MKWAWPLLLLVWMGWVAAAERPLPATSPTLTPSSSHVDVLFAGDTALHGPAGESIRRGRDPLQPFAALFKQADVRLLNLECVIAEGGKAQPKFYTFRAHPRVLPTLKRHVDGVMLANNHSGDYGHAAFAQMLGLLHTHGLAYAGGGMNLAQAHRPWVIERHGLRIAILSYNEFMPRSYEATADTPGVAWSEDLQVIDDILHAKHTLRADVVLPVMHWGWENEPVANARQQQLARRMIDAGADAVIGGHPHVTQNVEIYQGKPIIYSVGNFVMRETDNPAQRKGWIVRLRFGPNGAQAFDTHALQLDRQGLPHPLPTQATPCWSSGWDQPRACLPRPDFMPLRTTP